MLLKSWPGKLQISLICKIHGKHCGNMGRPNVPLPPHGCPMWQSAANCGNTAGILGLVIVLKHTVNGQEFQVGSNL